MSEFVEVTSLLFILLNPFLVIVYLVEILDELKARPFRRVLAKAGGISALVFMAFAVLGDAIFQNFVRAEFASFQIFGGVVFLMIGLRFVFRGNAAIESLRGSSRALAGTIAMPVLIGPGTLSASVIIGKRLDTVPALLSVSLAVAGCILTMMALKAVYDFVKPRNEALVERYIEVAGRVTALVVGAISVEMIMQGIGFWIHRWQ